MARLQLASGPPRATLGQMALSMQCPSEFRKAPQGQVELNLEAQAGPHGAVGIATAAPVLAVGGAVVSTPMWMHRGTLHLS